MPKTIDREEVAADPALARYDRLTDDHKVTACDVCGRVLLSHEHAEEKEPDRPDDGLPPLVHEMLRLGQRKAPYCEPCWRTPEHAGGGRRRMEKHLIEEDGAGAWQANALRDGEDSDPG